MSRRSKRKKNKGTAAQDKSSFQKAARCRQQLPSQVETDRELVSGEMKEAVNVEQMTLITEDQDMPKSMIEGHDTQEREKAIVSESILLEQLKNLPNTNCALVARSLVVLEHTLLNDSDPQVRRRALEAYAELVSKQSEVMLHERRTQMQGNNYPAQSSSRFGSRYAPAPHDYNR